MGKFVKRPETSAAAKPRKITDEARVWVESHPALWEYLTLTRWEGGEERATSTITLFAEDGVVKACLNDRALGRSLWAAADTVYEAIDALEGILASGSADWRGHRTGGKGRR